MTFRQFTRMLCRVAIAITAVLLARFALLYLQGLIYFDEFLGGLLLCIWTFAVGLGGLAYANRRN